MSGRWLATLAVFGLVLLPIAPLGAQVPERLSQRLLFKLGVTDAGWEQFSIERSAAGGYRLVADVDLAIPGLHIVQHVEEETGERLAFRRATVTASVNGDSSVATLVREGEIGRQTTQQRDSTTSSEQQTPAGSVLLTNNVIHHIAKFAWLHEGGGGGGGGGGGSREFFAFPRVPVSAALQDERTLERGGQTLVVRRYFVNLANRVGAYVWLATDGTLLKLSVPLQAFEAVSESHRDWSELLVLAPATPAGSEAPARHRAEEVKFESDSIALAGTLTLPEGRGPWPAAVLITGSGAQDRNENSPGPGGLKLSIFRAVADTLTGRGIAVLRYDDRGVGGSGGSLAGAGLSDLVSDVQAAVRYLRGRPEIDGSRVALIGHSEGGIIAPIVAAADTEIAAIVLMAGTALPLDSVILDQVGGAAREAGGDSAAVAEARAGMAQVLEAVREGRSLDSLDVGPELKGLESARKWLSEHMAHDPLATLRAVRAPVLVVNGGEDIQVPPRHAELLGAALAEAGHPDYEVKIFPSLNHLFAVSHGGGSAEYSDPNARVDAGFLGYLGDWLASRLARH